ncbi:Proliferation-associated protein 2G4 [Terramyces sp. JEL0728]|nr:Proliferation-associated protein 2G4 [Terramyces sp. JEL0728]
MTDKEEVEVNENELSPVNITKYQVAGDITTRAMKAVVDAVKAGSKVLDLCKLGDETIEKIAKTVYNKNKVQKGIAFPTCVSPNEYVCHLSPLDSDPEAALTLKAGDVVRIELGAHVDGYVSQAAQTVVVGASKAAPATGKKADVIKAAATCAEAAIRLIKPGNTNYQVTEVIDKIAAEFGCKAVEGFLTHQVLKNVLDGPKQIVLNPSEQQRKEIETHTFEQGEVYSVDLLISTGDGKPKPGNVRTTVFKRNADAVYQLKMNTARQIFSQIQKNCGTMAFSLRQLEDEKKARMGIIECNTHRLVNGYEVVLEKPDAHVAHVVFTILLMPNGPIKLSGTWDDESIVSEISVKEQEIVDLLASEYRKKKSKK